jgi:DEAD/DEAH box helicase domain-containing protein
VDDSAIPANLKPVLDGMVDPHPGPLPGGEGDKERLRRGSRGPDQTRFPHNLIRFVQQERGRIFQGFQQLFPELEPEGRAQLQAFLFDESGEHSFGFRLLNRLYELSRQRDSLQAQIKDLTRQRDKLKKQPQDPATDEEIQAIESERLGLMRLSLSINKKQTLNFFTDEGLLPNYAFPEEGVKLHSVIFRRAEKAERATQKKRSPKRTKRDSTNPTNG